MYFSTQYAARLPPRRRGERKAAGAVCLNDAGQESSRPVIASRARQAPFGRQGSMGSLGAPLLGGRQRPGGLRLEEDLARHTDTVEGLAWARLGRLGGNF